MSDICMRSCQVKIEEQTDDTTQRRRCEEKKKSENKNKIKAGTN